MATSTTQMGPRTALAVIFVVGIIGALIWNAMQIGNLRREQGEQQRRLQSAAATPVALATPAAEPSASAAASTPPNWAEQLADIRNETRLEIAKLQEQIRKKDPAEAQLASLRDENRAELTRLREEMTLSDQNAAKAPRDRQEDLLKSLRDQVRALDRRTAVLASAVRGTRAGRASRSARVARRKRMALSPVTTTRNRNVTVVYPSSRP